MKSNVSKEIYLSYLNSLLKGKIRHCHEIVNQLKDNDATLKNLYINLFQESLYEVGRLWEYNRISVAVEHMATSITESLMNIIYADLEIPDDSGFRAIITSSENEFHQIGAKMVSDTFEINGWETYYLGANTPVNDLINMIDEKNPHLIGISLSVYFHLFDLEKMIQKIRNKYPDLQIIIGGQAFKHVNGHTFAQKYSNIKFIESMDDLEFFIKEFQNEYRKNN